MARKRGDAWQADALVDGKRVRKTFATQELALAYERTTERAALDVRVGSLFPLWADKIWTGTKNERCAVGNANIVVKLLGAETSVHDVDFNSAQRLAEEMRNDDYSPSTVNKKLACLSALLRYGRKAGVLDKMPEIPFVKVYEGRITVLTFEQEDAMLAALPEHHRVFAAFCLYTGCRFSEATSLKWEDVDLTGSVQVRFSRTKTDKPRTLPLAKEALQALRWTREQGWFTPFAQIEYWTFARAWHKAREACGLGPEYIPYVMRHTCATRLAKAGMSELRLSIWLGHSNLTMTKKYVHFDTSDLEAGAASLERGPKLTIVGT